jgi:Lon protease-like protein
VVTLPIFPLPNSILYPGVYAPFRIFEERYKVMLKSIEQSGTEMAISYAPELQPGKFFPSMICGAGIVRVLKRYDTGESDILVFGTKRVKFDKYVQELPFLIGEGHVLELNREMPEKTEKDLLLEIRDMLINWLFMNFDDSSRAIQFFKNVEDLEPVCNFIAFHFVTDFEKKQKLLEENMLEAKAQNIWQILKDLDASGEPPPKNNLIVFPGSSGSESGGTIN